MKKGSWKNLLCSAYTEIKLDKLERSFWEYPPQ